jgi:hypothetical protein
MSVQDSAAAYASTYLNLRNGSWSSVYSHGTDHTEKTASSSSSLVVLRNLMTATEPLPSNWRIFKTVPI